MLTYLRVLRILNYAGLIWFGILGVAFSTTYFVMRFVFLDTEMPDYIGLPLAYFLLFAVFSAVFWSALLFILATISFVVEKRYFRKNNLQDKRFWQYPAFWLGILSATVFIGQASLIASGFYLE
ncbi:MAG TPA: hypothetical protein VJG64_00285 [Candidatus Paceibacterota bacterium]